MAAKGFYQLFVDLRASLDGLQGDMNKAVQIFESSSKKINGFVDGIGKVFKVVVAAAAVESVRRLGDAINDLAEKGEVAGSIAEQFEKLGGSSSAIQEAQKAVLGTVSAFELMKAANEGLLRQIPNLNQNFAKMSDFAGRFADATGRDTVEVLHQLVAAVGSGSQKALQQFGIYIEAGGTKSERMQAAIDQLNQSLERMGPMTESVANAHKALNVAFDEAVSNFGRGINESHGLAEAYMDLADAVRSIDWKKLGDDVGAFIGTVGQAISAVLKLFGQLENGIRAALLGFQDLEIKKLEILSSLDNTAFAMGPTPDYFTQQLKQAKAEFDKLFWDGAEKGIESMLDQFLGPVKDPSLFNTYVQSGKQANSAVASDRLEKDKNAANAAAKNAGKLAKDAISQTTQEAKHANSEWANDFQSKQDRAFSTLMSSMGDLFSSIQQIGVSVENIFGIQLPSGLKKALGVVGEIMNLINAISNTITAISNISSLFSGGGLLSGLLGGNTGGGLLGDVIGGAGDVLGGIGDAIGGVFGFAKGGIVDRPTLAVVGESGPEAIVPLRSPMGSFAPVGASGMGGGYIINIDARGASPGVEHAIRRAMKDVEERTIRRIISATSGVNDRVAGRI